MKIVINTKLLQKFYLFNIKREFFFFKYIHMLWIVWCQYVDNGSQTYSQCLNRKTYKPTQKQSLNSADDSNFWLSAIDIVRVLLHSFSPCSPLHHLPNPYFVHFTKLINTNSGRLLKPSNSWNTLNSFTAKFHSYSALPKSSTHILSSVYPQLFINSSTSLFCLSISIYNSALTSLTHFHHLSPLQISRAHPTAPKPPQSP